MEVCLSRDQREEEEEDTGEMGTFSSPDLGHGEGATQYRVAREKQMTSISSGDGNLT